MTSFSLRSKSFYHVRSVSLPSCPHPSNLQVDEHLSRLRRSQSTSPSLSAIGNKPSILEQMYDSFDTFLQLPSTQQAFAKNEKLVDEILDGHMRLLDLCANVKDITLLTKQDLQGLLSVLRRRRDTTEIINYSTSRKMAKKEIQKTLKGLKNIKFNHKNTENDAISSLFIAIEEATFEMFESMMTYIAGSKSQSRFSGLITKKFFRNSASPKSQVPNTNEFERVDEEVDFLIYKKVEQIENTMKFESLQSQLTTMESSLQDLDEGVESLFRRLIKTRVTLLNVINN